MGIAFYIIWHLVVLHRPHYALFYYFDKDYELSFHRLTTITDDCGQVYGTKALFSYGKISFKYFRLSDSDIKSIFKEKQKQVL